MYLVISISVRLPVTEQIISTFCQILTPSARFEFCIFAQVTVNRSIYWKRFRHIHTGQHACCKNKTLFGIVYWRIWGLTHQITWVISNSIHVLQEFVFFCIPMSWSGSSHVLDLWSQQQQHSSVGIFSQCFLPARLEMGPWYATNN